MSDYVMISPLNLGKFASLLGGGIPTPLKNMKVNWEHYSQYMEKYKKILQSTNQFKNDNTGLISKVIKHISPQTNAEEPCKITQVLVQVEQNSSNSLKHRTEISSTNLLTMVDSKINSSLLRKPSRTHMIGKCCRLILSFIEF